MKKILLFILFASGIQAQTYLQLRQLQPAATSGSIIGTGTSGTPQYFTTIGTGTTVLLSGSPNASGTATLANLVITGTCSGCGGGGSGIPYTGAIQAMDFNNQLAGNIQRLSIGSATNAISPLYVTTSVPTYTGSYFTDSEPGIVYAVTTNSTTNSNSHGFVFAQQFIKSNNGLANNAFTDNSSIWGSANYDHHASYQAAFSFNGSGTLGYYDFIAPTCAVTSGVLSTYRPLHIVDASVSGSGVLTSQYGLYVEPLASATTNEAIHVVSNKSVFGGPLNLFTTSSSANALAPEIAWFHASTFKTSSIVERAITNTSALDFNTSVNFGGAVRKSFSIVGDDTNTGTDTVHAYTHYFRVDAINSTFPSSTGTVNITGNLKVGTNANITGSLSVKTGTLNNGWEVRPWTLSTNNTALYLNQSVFQNDTSYALAGDSLQLDVNARQSLSLRVNNKARMVLTGPSSIGTNTAGCAVNFLSQTYSITSGSNLRPGFIKGADIKQWPGTGVVTTQIENFWMSPVYSMSTANTMSYAIGNVFMAPTTGTNITITNKFSAILDNNVLVQGNLKIAPTGSTNPVAGLELPPGTTTLAPMRFNSGPLTTGTNIVQGGVEFLTDKFYGTISTGTVQKEFALWDATGTSGRVPFETTNNRLTDDAGLTYATTTGFSTNSITATGPVTLNTGTIVTDATGLKIGNSTSQKVALFGATPVAQQSAATDLGVVLSNMGIRVASSNYAITNGGTVAFTGANVSSTKLRLGSGTIPTANLDVTGTMSISTTGTITGNATFGTHIIGLSTAPSFALGAGAGATSTATLGTNSTDIAGTVSVTTAGVPGASGIIITLTFNTAYATAPHVALTAKNAATALLSGTTMVFPGTSTTVLTINSNTTGIVTGTVYVWDYVLIQ